MQIKLGFDSAARKRNETVEVTWDKHAAVNPHMLIVGMTGVGKTYQLRKIIREMQATAPRHAMPRFHVFDVHGDIDIEGASTVQFSEQTPWGFNPLRINPDPHYGGVRKRVQGFMDTLNTVMRQMGHKQEATLRNILFDVYARHGFRQDDPSTWRINEDTARLVSDGSDNRLYIDVPKGEKEDLKALKIGAQWDGDLICWWIPPDQYQGAVTRWPPKVVSRTHPSIADVLRHARNILQMSFLGTGMKAITHLEIANKAAAAFQRKRLEALRRGERGYEDEAMQADLEKAKQKAIETFAEYAQEISTGRELTDVMKYDSTDVLKSVVDRLENLQAIGIFKPAPPPFDPKCGVWRYHIKALSLPEQQLFVRFRLQDLFMQAVQRGEQTDLLDVAVVDEAARFADPNPDSPLNLISNEARKFGLGLIAASQSPTHFPDDFLAAVATKIVLGIDEMHWPGSIRKMRLTEDALAWIKPQRSMLVQLKMKGATKNDWRWTYFQ